MTMNTNTVTLKTVPNPLHTETNRAALFVQQASCTCGGSVSKCRESRFGDPDLADLVYWCTSCQAELRIEK